MTRTAAQPTISGPATGRMVRSFSLRADDDRVVHSRDFRQRSNLVLIFHHGLACRSCRACRATLDDIDRNGVDIETARARVLAIGPAAEDRRTRSRPDDGPAILHLADHEGTVAKIQGFDPPAVIVADRFGKIWAAWEGGPDHRLPDAREIIEWLEFIEIQCPECHPPEPWE